jgi:hypothetical protein
MTPPSREFQGGVFVSTENWPIILLEFPERRFPDATFRDAMQFIEELMKDARSADGKTYQITDLTRMRELAPASQRKFASKWLASTFQLQRMVSIGASHVAPSTIVRGLITAIDWLQKSALPATYVATREEAFAIAIKCFDDAHFALPADVRARLTERRAPAR